MASSQIPAGDRTRGKSISYGDNGIGVGSGGLATMGRFVPSDPRNTELGWGIVHLYRDAEETLGLYDTTEGNPSSEGSSESGEGALATDNEKSTLSDDCTTLCILAVPSYLTPSDFLGFVGEKTRDQVSHFRMIRTGRINRYMVLMKFRDPTMAREWRREWNGKVFNSMESIRFQPSLSTADPSSFPDMTHDPFTPKPTPNIVAVSPTGTTPTTASSVASSSLSTKPLAPPTPALIELPTCPVCLERMDETTGLLTILCQHVFHCACLQKWKGSGCPVCRYTQGDGLSVAKGGLGSAVGNTENTCSVCGSEANLWICLICGNVGCGRYDEAHAFSHYQETSHCYAMDVDTQRVWDYAGDGYVHRLIQNKSDGKLVELPSAFANSRGGANSDYTGLGGDYVPREKLDNIGMEYTYLLTSQLDSQRLYYEEKFAQAADKASKAAHDADQAAGAASRTMQQLEELQGKYGELIKDVMPSLERDKERAERKAEKLGDMARKMEKEWKEEKAMNGSLMERIDFMSKELQGLKLMTADLQEQNRDLTFFISSQEKLKDQGEDIQEGTITVGDAPSLKKGRKGKGTRR
ncbi:hypothetical protein FGG08_005938 [Glutinoglossum americanum]|uniref:Uncharacterized protein n=1 Tax=Glutinoglossum americanum TaxID=1670608 RepID=A0A9P8KXZ7_9PEZI|nr:hypothetical protein FGG08_005938 [Glutinoglossum americanum]